ncbi:U3 small nucleolar ribonucleoprotein MPP10-like [Tropilaelaps mercedesae]|uniref:U3 small nucleolar ribonucleoprotein protein MPP10 n=1 Tax=Tropilaelaps mercedesae TaxID=418985 RepID=A0A1V9XH47_9ACAR|nr:U3 small nucleolar ribonucleoprotein MPP10-like [Tropilaelaps mercedesae]
MAPGTRSSKNSFARIESDLETLTKDITQFLKTNDKSVEKFRQLSKSLYDGLKREDRCEGFRNKEDLDHLIIDEFDDEQIWQELELRNQPLLEISVTAVSRLSTKADVDFGIELNDDEEGGEADDKEMVDANNDDEGLETDAGVKDPDEELDEKDSEIEEDDIKGDPQNITVIAPASTHKPFRKTVVDDKFFKLGALEKFLDSEDQREERKMRRQKKAGADSEASYSDDEDDESVEYFGDLPSDDDGREARYNDFFDPIEGLREIEKQEQNSDLFSRKSKSCKSHKSVRFADDEIGEEEKEGEEYNGENGEQGDDDDGEEGELGEEGGDYDLRDAEDEDVEEDETEAAMKTTRDLFKDSDEDNTDEDRNMSTFQKNQKKLRQKIAKLEEHRLADKDWKMRGEISARNRPENSLMEEHLDFDHQTRQAPQITRTLTQKLEDWIVQRVKDKTWDDVVRKVKPTEEVFEFRRRLTLDQEKSKVGLAEVYEQEYLKMKEGERETTNPDHEEIKKMMGALFKQLDALSNYHFMPKPAQAELRIVNNLPTIAVEEVAPATVSDGTMLAPEEIKLKPKRDVLAKDERSKTDKNRERRLKKVHQRRKRKLVEEKEARRAERDPKFKERLERKTARENLQNSTNTKVLKTAKKRDSALKSSTKFFECLQDQIVNQVDAKKQARKQRELKRQRVGALKL